MKFYKWLTDNHYHWDRKDSKHIWVSLPGYSVFDERYENLMAMASTCNMPLLHLKHFKFPGCKNLVSHTVYIFKHK